MTTTKAEALRELETLASACPELNMANYTDDDVRHLNDWAIEVSQVIEKIATHPAKCDGNHGGPRCADPECWNDSPAQPQPVAIPAELRFSVRHRIVEDAGYKGPTAEHNAIIQGVLDHLRAPAQPATTERKGPLSKDQIRGVFLAHGFTVKDGQADLKPYVYDAAYALIALVQSATERKGEPVAWMRKTDITELVDFEPETEGWMPLYTSPQVPEGFALVPVEPTPEMIHAVRFAGDVDRPTIGERIVAGETAYPFVGADVALRMCRAMIDAARKEST